MAELVQTLQAGLGQVEIRLGARVSNVMPVDGSYLVHLADGELLAADAVILATPAFVSAGLVAGFDMGMAAALGAIPARIHRHRGRWLIRWRRFHARWMRMAISSRAWKAGRSPSLHVYVCQISAPRAGGVCTHPRVCGGVPGRKMY